MMPDDTPTTGRRFATSYEVNDAKVQALDALTGFLGDARRLVQLAIEVVNEERKPKP
jgi:hypothetical protein